MNIERARLKRMNPLVNAGSSLVLLMAISACGGQDENETKPGVISNLPQELPVVWGSEPLPKPVVDMQLSEGAKAVLAVAYEGAGVQMFDFEGAPIGDEADLKIARFARGQTAFFDNVPLVLFPALREDGSMSVIATGDGLVAPIALDLNVGNAYPIRGLCAGSAGGAEGSLMRIGYWTLVSPRTLAVGEVTASDDGTLSFQDTVLVSSPEDISACSFDAGGAVLASGPLVRTASELASEDMDFSGRFRLSAALLDLSVLRAENGASFFVGLQATGQVVVQDINGSGQALLLRPGLTVSAPEAPVAMSAIGEPRGGGYPFGVIALAGETDDGASRIVFVDTQALIESAVRTLPATN